jgi:cytochrome P450
MQQVIDPRGSPECCQSRQMFECGDAADLMDVFAKPLPARVIAGQLGVPASDHQHFRHWLDLMISTDPDEFAQAPRRSPTWSKRSCPGDDLISEFAIASDADKKFTGVELLAIAFALLVAGYETSSTLIGNGTLALFEHPDQLEKRRRQPSLIGSPWKR